MVCGRAEISGHLAISREKQPQSIMVFTESTQDSFFSGPDQVLRSVSGDAETRPRGLTVLAEAGLIHRNLIAA